QKIKSLMLDMDQSLKLLYEQTIDGIPLNTIFEHYIKDKDVHEKLTPKLIHQVFNKYFNKPNFELIKALETTFDTNEHLKRFLEISSIYIKYPWILKLDSKVSRSSKLEFKEFHESYLGYKDSIRHKGFFKRR